MKNYLLTVALFIGILSSFAQNYEFSTVVDLEATDVISQGNTGTCWSFSTTSFLESEIIRITGKKIDLSEMYTVRQTYPIKAWNYVMRQGKAQFSQGGLAHDVINSVRKYGLVPESAYSGLLNGSNHHNHSEFVPVLKSVLDAYIDNPGRELSSNWKNVVENILDLYLGKKVTSFNYEGMQYTPESFLKMTKLNPDDYVTLTSFTHEPYYSKFILSIPDNFSNGSFYNVKLEELIATIKEALNKGYTVALDCDVSEKTFSAKNGVAVIPEDEAMQKEILTEIEPEKQITPEFRQREFEDYNTTDDHLMHITGLVKDQKGNFYFKVKNSWGTDESRVANGGYVYMSEAYAKLKTISILLHKDAISKDLKQKLNLN